MQDKLLRWLDEEYESRDDIKNDHQLSQAADITPSVISKARVGRQEIGWEACSKIAKALDVPVEVVLVKAGHIEEDYFDQNKWDEETRRLVQLFSKIPKSERAEILMLLKYKLDKSK